MSLSATQGGHNKSMILFPNQSTKLSENTTGWQEQKGRKVCSYTTSILNVSITPLVVFVYPVSMIPSFFSFINFHPALNNIRSESVKR